VPASAEVAIVTDAAVTGLVMENAMFSFVIVSVHAEVPDAVFPKVTTSDVPLVWTAVAIGIDALLHDSV